MDGKYAYWHRRQQQAVDALHDNDHFWSEVETAKEYERGARLAEDGRCCWLTKWFNLGYLSLSATAEWESYKELQCDGTGGTCDPSRIEYHEGMMRVKVGEVWDNVQAEMDDYHTSGWGNRD